MPKRAEDDARQERISQTRVVNTETRRNANNKRASRSKPLLLKFLLLPAKTKLGWIVLALGVVECVIICHSVAQGDWSLLDAEKGRVFGGTLRIFIAMFCLWLAWPQLEVIPKRWLILPPILTIICALRPRLIPIVAGPIFLILLLRPTTRKTNADAQKSKTIKKKNAVVSSKTTATAKTQKKNQ